MKTGFFAHRPHECAPAVLIQAKKKGVLAQMAKGKGGKAGEEEAAKKYAFVKQFVLDGASVDTV